MKSQIWKDLSRKQRASVLKRPTLSINDSVKEQVPSILQNIKIKGDGAIRKYIKEFDGIDLLSFNTNKISSDLNPEVCLHIDLAYKNIKSFHEKQGFQPYTFETISGVKCGRIVRPIQNVGLYVPGGTAPLISTALMLGAPAQIAGSPKVQLFTPCNKDGSINPYLLYAANLCGIENIFKIGGAQAIGAMAYGTDTIIKCDKIFGPGNAYVTEAKMQVSKEIDGPSVDLPAGPSEVCVIADKNSNAAFVAADLLSQAEHDINSQVLLITSSEDFSREVNEELERQIMLLSRRNIAEKVLENSYLLIVDNNMRAIEIANEYSPEHLIICLENPESYLDDIQNAGSIFLGQWAPEAAGDYATGTNHVLPTFGNARSYSGLCVESFQKTMTVQTISQLGLEKIGKTVKNLALIEGLDAHARAISIREGIND